MKTIWKYPLPIQDGVIELEMPVYAIPVTVQMQPGGIGKEATLCLWAIVETTERKTKHRFWVVGTGEELPDEYCQYINTVQTNDGMLVWHVFCGV